MEVIIVSVPTVDESSATDPAIQMFLERREVLIVRTLCNFTTFVLGPKVYVAERSLSMLANRCALFGEWLKGYLSDIC